MNSKEEEFEMVGLIKTLKENLKKNSSDLKNEIISRVNTHIGTIPLSDDFTLLILRKTA
jgi:serine phosphatase RsbU (regulator of sigma subunit)